MKNKLRLDVVKGTAVLSIGEFLSYGLSFARNIILARALTKSDFGIAATFAMAIAVFELSSKLAIGRLIVQDKEGESQRFIATAHFVQLVSGVIGGLVLFLFSDHIAVMFEIGSGKEYFSYLSILLVMKGLENLDLSRLERNLNYVPSTISVVVPQFLLTIIAWPLAKYMPDYRTVFILVVSKAIFTTILTQILAHRSYQLAFDIDYTKKIFVFSWPLLINAFLLFGVFQGDQVIVGAHYGMSDLAAFAAAGALATAPSFIFARIFPSVMLPIMAKTQDDAELFSSRYRVIVGIVSAFAVFYSGILIIGAEAFMRVIYGTKYFNSGIILAWLATANTLRIFRFAPSTAALAKADSKNQMYANILRVSVLGPALYLAFIRQPIWIIAAIGFVGELMACILSLYKLNKRDRIPWSSSLYPGGVVVLWTMLFWVIFSLTPITKLGIFNIFICIVVASIASLITAYSNNESRRHLLLIIKDFQGIANRTNA